MDKILSARVDESIIRQVGLLARELNTTNKAIIEASIKLYSQQVGLDSKIDAINISCGAWKREESPKETISTARSAFNKSMKRHHQ